MREIPEIMAESMQSAMQIIQRSIKRMNTRVQVETAELLKESQKKAGPVPATKD